MPREIMEFDVLIVGAGPAGLSTAIHLANLSKKLNNPLSIAVLEKGPQIGAHILSGAVFDPRALTALLPDWKDLNAPLSVPVKKDHFYFLSSKRSYSLPVPKLMKNCGNFIISLGELCQWLGQQAEGLGINIFPGFSGQALLFNSQKTSIRGIQLGDFGLEKNNQPSDRFQLGPNIFAKQTVFAEGCRGSLTQQLIQHFNLKEKADPQTYAIGIKELWRIPKEKHEEGTVWHTLGWPLKNSVYGGGFLYHFKDQLISLGLVVGLDYKNPYLDPFLELQQLKRHPKIQSLLEGGECVEYGAKALNEGGLQSIGKLVFPGGMLVGCSAGMVNVGKIKGIHNAIYSGILAAQSIIENFPQLQDQELKNYQTSFNNSSIYRELYTVRNLRPGFRSGVWKGLIYAAFDQYLLRGKAPWTLHHRPDYTQLLPKAYCQPIIYPKPDNKITFDKLTQVFLSGTKHRENQPCHLKIKDPVIPPTVNLPLYGGPETRYCPALVYEYVIKNNEPILQINAANCIHCKTCDIKDPKQNIIWTPPEGGDGPNYQQM